VTQYVDSYILQWAYFERAVAVGGSAGQDMWDTITHPQHKAKVMFYYEVLNSLDYRGSMTSLQSGFSVVSKTSAHLSTSGISSGVSSNLSETTTGARSAHGLIVDS
jgi:hypothetical protein